MPCFIFGSLKWCFLSNIDCPALYHVILRKLIELSDTWFAKTKNPISGLMITVETRLNYSKSYICLQYLLPNPNVPRGSPAKFSDRPLLPAAKVKLPAPARMGAGSGSPNPMQPSTSVRSLGTSPKCLNRLCLTLFLSLRSSLLLVHLFLPNFFLPVIFAFDVLWYSTLSRATPFRNDLLWLTLFVEGVNKFILDHCQVGCLPHYCGSKNKQPISWQFVHILRGG